MKKKSIIWGIITVMVFAVATASMFSWYFDSHKTKNSSNQTASWKTYTNSQYGFSFEYPADGVIKKISPNDETLYFTTAQQTIEAQKHDGTEFPLYIFDIVYDFNRDTKNIKSVSNVNLNGVQWARFIDEGAVYDTTVYQVKQNGNNLDFELIDSSQEDLLKQILSTFEFTNSTMNQTADWKTYTSSELKISFQYPANWHVIPNYSYSAAGAGGLVGYVLTPSASQNPSDQDRIDIGGAQVDCQHLVSQDGKKSAKDALCKTSLPVYTFSSDSNVINVFKSIVNNIKY